MMFPLNTLQSHKASYRPNSPLLRDAPAREPKSSTYATECMADDQACFHCLYCSMHDHSDEAANVEENTSILTGLVSALVRIGFLVSFRLIKRTLKAFRFR